MVRKRNVMHRIEKMTHKKRRLDGPISRNVSTSEESGALDDRILNLYKLDTSTTSMHPLLPTEELSSNEPNKESKSIGSSEGSNLPKQVLKETRKKKSAVLTLNHSTVTFKDVGGQDKILMDIFKHFIHLKKDICSMKLANRKSTIFLHGPPGSGKSHLVQAVAGEMNIPYIEVAATELVSGISGESESKIRDMFEEAIRSSPCILFIDHIDAICPSSETSDKSMERRMVSQLSTCLSELKKKDISSKVKVFVATNKPDFINPVLRGHFKTEIAIGLPNESTRLKILQVLCKNLKLSPNFDMQWVAHHTPGFVGGDLQTLVDQAREDGEWRLYKKSINAFSTKVENDGVSIDDSCLLPKFECKPDSEPSLDLALSWYRSECEAEMTDCYIELQDFQAALQKCIPYSKREGFASVPNVTWDDIGALEEIKKKLQTRIIWPLKYREEYENGGMSNSKGILLFGPKGCGKTLLAKALANEISINFLSVKGPELLSKYFGESERAIRQCFERAKNSAPCVIFFDEVDALCPSRSTSSANPAIDNVVNQLLTMMDGMEERKEVFVIGATNRLDKIDSAILRPGRLDKVIYVDVPSPAERVQILKCLTKNKTKPKISDEVDLEALGQSSKCEGFSGADLNYLVQEAFTEAMEEYINSADSSSERRIVLKMKHFESALKVVKPSITDKDKEYFKKHRPS